MLGDIFRPLLWPSRMAFMLHNCIEYPGVVEQSDQYSKILREESTSHP